MQRREIDVGGVRLAGNALLAPLAGYTDFAFRALALEYGAALCFTEMVSCKGLVYGSAKTEELLYPAPNETIRACQVFGRDPDIMREALCGAALAPFSIVDVNMGCPVPKVFRNGEGSALLLEPKLAEKIVSECAKTGKIVTVKMRLGARRGECVAAEFARRLAGAGAKMIAVHGRYREDYYSGEPDYAGIRAAVEAAGREGVPVVANGGIFSRADADRMLEETGAAGVMVARGALGRPWIFRELYGEEFEADVLSAVEKQLSLLLTRVPERRAIVNFRKAAAYYVRGMRGGKEAKERIFRAETSAELLSAFRDLKAREP